MKPAAKYQANGKSKKKGSSNVLIRNNGVGGPRRSAKSKLRSGNAAGVAKTKSDFDHRLVCKFHLQGTCKFGCPGNGSNYYVVIF